MQQRWEQITWFLQSGPILDNCTKLENTILAISAAKLTAFPYLPMRKDFRERNSQIDANSIRKVRFDFSAHFLASLYWKVWTEPTKKSYSTPILYRNRSIGTFLRFFSPLCFNSSLTHFSEFFWSYTKNILCFPPTSHKLPKISLGSWHTLLRHCCWGFLPLNLMLTLFCCCFVQRFLSTYPSLLLRNWP